MYAVHLCDYTAVCEAYTLLRQVDIIIMGSLTSADMWVRAVHTNGVQAHTTSVQGGLRGIENCPSPCLTLPHQGIEPRVFGFEFRRTNH